MTNPALVAAWTALDGDPAAVGALTVTGPDRRFGGRLDCDGLLRACAGSALLAAADLAAARGLGRPAVALDGGVLAVAATSERHAAVAGRPSPPAFAPLSRFVATADGHVRLHANYPHHRAAVLAVLGPDDPVAAAAGWRAEALEAAVVAAGGCAAAVRTPAQWAAHPQGRWSAGTPLVTWDDRPPAAPLPAPTGGLPASGLKVLDLTRVIAGPVATRMLAALGADVLRLGHPGRPELPLQVVDGLVGKRAALLDLAATDRLEALLAEADVLVGGYRPGALDRFGLAPAALARRHPHLVDVRLSAWGDGGPWGDRRGFDSLVQAATGIATIEGTGAEGTGVSGAGAEGTGVEGTGVSGAGAATIGGAGGPGALPAQVLDHGTGLLAAAAALRGLTARAVGDGPPAARLALARTATWLLTRPVAPAPTVLPRPVLLDLPAEGAARVTAVRPPGTLDGVPLTWTHAHTSENSDPPHW